MPASGYKKESSKKLISARVPMYIYNVVIDYAEKNGCSTSKAVEDILAGGINFLMMMENSEVQE